MLFNSIDFAVFLLISFLLYWYVFNKNGGVRNIFIIVISYIFYGWWDWRFLLLIAFTSLCSYLSGIAISSSLNEHRRTKARWYCGINIAINLGILCLFKYYNFFMTEFAARFLNGDTSGMLVKLILPVGISFYTFQALSYSIDVYRRKMEATRNIGAFFAYIAFFPQLVAGPIERATNLLPQFYTIHKFNYNEAVDGMRRILWGLFKKVVVADSCAVIVNDIFASYEWLPGNVLLLGGILFAFQIYGDFSGYSDIAIGTAQLFGFHLMPNFRNPYFSRNIGEFWRRWHISLNTWFRDYVYIPLGGSRVKKTKVVRNTFVIFLLSGLWHGANWTFITWGGFHALLFCPMILTGNNRKYTDEVAPDRRFPTFSEMQAMAITFFLVVIGWIVFRSETITEAWNYIRRMFGSTFFSIPTYFGGSPSRLALTIGVIAIMLGVEWFQRKREHGMAIGFIRQRWLRWLIYYAIIVAMFFSDSVETFIYFQF